MKTNSKKFLGIALIAILTICLATVLISCNNECEHQYEYSHDAESHWQVCSVCEDTTEKTPHSFDSDGKCVCGYQQVKSFNVESSVTVNVDETHTLVISDLVGLTASDITYSSYDPSIASIDASGVITGVAEGETTVLVKAGSLRKTVSVTVIERNKLNNVSYKTYKNMTSMDWSDTGIGNGAVGALTNIAWDGGTQATTAEKMDFEGTKGLDAKVLRGSVSGKNASIDNGDYVIVMSSANEAEDSAFSASVYYKVTVNELANSFRLWGWASKSDLEASPASGKGMFRVVAYVFDEDYTSYSTVVLPGLDLGSLSADANGWISYEDVDDTLNGHILGAPADNMFVYGVSDGTTDIRGKEVIISVEFRGLGNATPDRFGIKRLGFIYDDAPDFSLTSASEVTLFAGNTSQITLGTAGAAVKGNWTFTSDNQAVATVDASGLITAQNVSEAGTCTITVSNDKVSGKTITVSVTVNPTPETSFNVPTSLEVSNGQNATIVISDKVSCEAGFTYESASARIATVSADGVITGVVPGKTQIKVTCGDLYKYIDVTVTATSLYGMDIDTLGTVGNLGNLGGFPSALDFTWSGLTTSDNVSDNVTDAKIHLYSADSASLNDLSDSSLVNMINNISGNSGNGITNAIYFKYNTPETAGEFRVWIRANEAMTDISGTSYFRVVVYVLNDEGTAYVPHIMRLNAVTSATATQDESTGIITITGGAGDNFVNFVPTADMLGKSDVIIAIEAFANTDSDDQSRLIVRRMGFDQ